MWCHFQAARNRSSGDDNVYKRSDVRTVAVYTDLCSRACTWGVPSRSACAGCPTEDGWGHGDCQRWPTDGAAAKEHEETDIRMNISSHDTERWADFVILIHWGRDKMVDFLIGHYTYRMFPPAIDIIPTSLAVVYSNGKYTNYKN